MSQVQVVEYTPGGFRPGLFVSCEKWEMMGQ